MRISFVYKQDDYYWNDGLKKAIEILSERHEIRRHNGTYTNYLANFILVWGAFGSWQEREVANIEVPKGICVAGGPINHPDIHKFDVVFVETKWHQRQFRKLGVNAVLAFGTNTELFYNQGLPRTIDRIYPSAYAAWKRHNIFLKKDGGKMTVGYVQPNNVEHECFDICLQDPLTVALDQVTPETLAYLYNQSHTVNITADIFGGGERSILEGLACGCNVEVEPDNDKLVELLEETKKYIPNHIDYANVLKNSIEEIYEASAGRL